MSNEITSITSLNSNENVGHGSYMIDIIETVVSSVVILLVIYMVLAFPEVIVGPSMEPTLQTGDRILVERLTKNFGDYNRGDVVVFNPPGMDGTDYVKRVIGMPGDIIKISDCGVLIAANGEKFQLDEPYLYPDTCTEGSTQVRTGRSIQIDEDLYLVLGDNRDKSQDSRNFGLIERDKILGKAIFRFWPLSKAGFL